MGKTTDLRIALNQNGIKWNEPAYSDDLPPKMYDRITWTGEDQYLCDYQIIENDNNEFEVHGLTIPQIIKALSSQIGESHIINWDEARPQDRWIVNLDCGHRAYPSDKFCHECGNRIIGGDIDG